MKIINASYEILYFPTDALSLIEKAARTCYKSEKRIGPGSAERLVETLVNSGHEAMLEFGGTASVKFIVDRGISHELVRHRIASFAQESTRYCDYSKGKFGEEITVIDPRPSCLLLGPASYENWKATMSAAENSYSLLRQAGVPAEIARGVLPQSLKAEINVAANIREWRLIFRLRTSKKAHPQMREVMIPLLKEFRSRVPILFDDVGPQEDNLE